MNFRIINLTALFIIHCIEDILLTYPRYPYQKAFAIPYWKEKLITSVVSHFPCRFKLVESENFQYEVSELLPMSTERALAIENQIKISIMIILQENPDWEKYADWQKPLSGQLFIPDIGVNRRFLQPGAISG